MLSSLTGGVVPTRIDVLALADDLTGALEIGAKFRAAGVEAVVSTRRLHSAAVPVVVYDTETRHLSGRAAAREVARFAAGDEPSLVYKKTDSTLRGNIATELEALARLFPRWRIGYAPAYPAMGRTVKAGILHVHGVPVSETEFARDALNPVRSSSVAGLLHPDLACTVFDAENDEHMAEAARAILCETDMRIAAGPAGLAENIARAMDLPRSAPPDMPRIRTCLVLNGSRHATSAIQMREAEAPGWKVVVGEFDQAADARAAAAVNAGAIARQIASEKPDAIFVIGGDTAFAVARELGCTSFVPVGEVVPGVPLSIVHDGLYLITKAGGFGDGGIIARVRARLSDD